MNNSRRYLAAALLTLVTSGPALAHDDGRYNYYPDSAWSGGATVYVGSQGITGWSGTLGIRLGSPAAPVYVPRVVALPPPHVHGPACGHGYAKPWRKAHKHGYDRGHDHHRRGRGGGHH